jgi:dienelactone hydrolase
MSDKRVIKKSISKRKMIGCSILLCLFLLIIATVKYLTFVLPADEEALLAMNSNEQVTVEQIGNTIVFTPTQKVPTKGFIYYPGGQVEAESFAYAANEIAKSGIKVIIQRMPFNLAMFGKDRAFDLISTYSDMNEWYIGGFSLGGVSACMAASENPDIFDGVILYASYTTKSDSLSESGIKVLSLSGSNDGLATPDKIENAKKFLPIDTTFIQVPGGNHTQMAIYGEGNLQKGDNEASLSRMEQQKILIEETTKFILQEEEVGNQ